MALAFVVLVLAAACVSVMGQGGNLGGGQGQDGFGGDNSFQGGPGGQFGGGPGGQFGNPGGFPGGMPGGFPGGFPGGMPGGFPGGFPGQGGLFPNFGQNAFQQQQQIITCIGTNEAQDVMKITIRPENNFPMPPFQQRRETLPQTWRISGTYSPALSMGHISPAGTTSLVGEFFLAITRYGRTDGSCAGMGGVLQTSDTLSGTDDLNNPYLQALRNQQNMMGQPPGYIQDPIVISQGGNVYSGVVRNVAEYDLLGRGLAICMDHYCQKPMSMCCTLAKDSIPATDHVGPIAGQGSGGLMFNTVPGARTAGTTATGLTPGGATSLGGLF